MGGVPLHPPRSSGHLYNARKRSRLRLPRIGLLCTLCMLPAPQPSLMNPQRRAMEQSTQHRSCCPWGTCYIRLRKTMKSDRCGDQRGMAAVRRLQAGTRSRGCTPCRRSRRLHPGMCRLRMGCIAHSRCGRQSCPVRILLGLSTLRGSCGPQAMGDTQPRSWRGRRWSRSHWGTLPKMGGEGHAAIS